MLREHNLSFEFSFNREYISIEHKITGNNFIKQEV